MKKDLIKKAVTSTQLDLAKERIRKIASKCDRFKIGETGQTLEQRFSDPEYSSNYDTISSIYKSQDKTLIDNLEEKLIEYAMRYYPTKCDNRSPKSHGMTTDKKEPIHYSIYMVHKTKKSK